MLALEGVHVTINAFPILRGVTLSVPPGRVVGLVGRNGAGKTTTLKSVMGLVPVHAGRIRFAGRDLVRTPAYMRARLGIGYMPEDRRLVGALTVEENLLLPLWAVGDGRADRLTLAYRLIPEVRAMAGRRAAELSGGQQKLVAMARALVTGTRLLLLDEPFEGLAPGLARRLGEVIRGLRGQGIAVLVAESDPRRVEELADAVFIIERGEIVAPGQAPE